VRLGTPAGFSHFLVDEHCETDRHRRQGVANITLEAAGSIRSSEPSRSNSTLRLVPRELYFRQADFVGKGYAEFQGRRSVSYTDACSWITWFRWDSAAQGGMNMGYDNQPRSSSASVVIILVLLVFMMLGGMLVVGVGGWFLVARSRMQREVAIEQRQRAIEAQQMARAMAEEAEVAAEAARMQAGRALKTVAEFEKEVVGKTQDSMQITLQLDRDGELTVDGEPADLDRLNRIMESAVAEKDATITIEVLADEQCTFRHVEEVVSLCQEWGVARFRLRTLDPQRAYKAADDKKPAAVVR
jgi:biopolymer transport protein ExbD